MFRGETGSHAEHMSAVLSFKETRYIPQLCVGLGFVLPSTQPEDGATRGPRCGQKVPLTGGRCEVL